MPHFWVWSILDRLFRPSVLAALAALPLLAAPGAIETLARAYRDKPTAANRAALERFAASHPRDPDGALALLSIGATAAANNQSSEALAALRRLGKRLPSLADYQAFAEAQARFDDDASGAVKSAELVAAFSQPKSPLAARAALLAARAWIGANEPKRALALLQQQYAGLPQPQTDLLLATAFQASGDNVRAVVYCQRVYYGFPGTKEAAEAGETARNLRKLLGDAYPPAMPPTMLARALKLLDAKQPADARRELEELAPLLSGPDQELARVRIGVANFNARETGEAFRYLKGLSVSSPEVDAERLYYLLAAARRLKNQEEVNAALKRLAQQYPNSRWRLEALVQSANHYLLENQPEQFEPLYRACFESFPKDSQGSQCHWKYAWSQYLRRKAEAPERMREHLRLYPQSEHSAAALYYLGRIAESHKDAPAARSYYEEILRLFPNYYYMTLARERLKVTGRAEASPRTAEFLRSLALRTDASQRLTFDPSPVARQRLERARLLETAALDEWAELELRFGAQNDGQPHVFAQELAELSTRRGAPDQGLRWIKRYVPGYLMLPLDAAPARFWQLAFPLPFREDVERNARDRGLDPYLLAALIRQESEFNPKAISRSKAYGLTQVLPSTGRELSRRLQIKPFTAASLFVPSINLKLGAYYLRTILNSLEGQVEAALASYNAGRSRAVAWQSWGDFREPSEYVETIPFTETRDYVQSVLRNADVYRRLYGLRPQPAATAAIK